jgi:hypothetical protein
MSLKAYQENDVYRKNKSKEYIKEKNKKFEKTNKVMRGVNIN